MTLLCGGFDFVGSVFDVVTGWCWSLYYAGYFGFCLWCGLDVLLCWLFGLVGFCGRFDAVWWVGLVVLCCRALVYFMVVLLVVCVAVLW